MAVIVSTLHATGRPTGGPGSISGNVKDDTGANAVRTVLLYDALSNKLLRETVSGTDGNYTFTDLQIGLVVDVRVKDDDAGTTYNDKVHSRVVVA